MKKKKKVKRREDMAAVVVDNHHHHGASEVCLSVFSLFSPFSPSFLSPKLLIPFFYRFSGQACLTTPPVAVTAVVDYKEKGRFFEIDVGGVGGIGGEGVGMRICMCMFSFFFQALGVAGGFERSCLYLMSCRVFHFFDSNHAFLYGSAASLKTTGSMPRRKERERVQKTAFMKERRHIKS